MVTFTIEFDRPDKKYRSGETVRCDLYVRVAEKFTARYLAFHFKGYAHTEWIKPERQKVDGKTIVTQVKYVGHEEYFKHCEYLLGSIDSNDDNSESSGGEDIEVGYYHYKIAYKLPDDDLPSNIECRNGSVRYTVKVKYSVINGPDKSLTIPFLVTSEVSKIPDLLQPIQDVTESYYGLCCFRPRPLEITHYLPRLGFSPGETLPVKIEINNQSSVRVEFIKVELLKNLIFMTTSPEVDKLTETKLLNEHIFYTKVPAGECKEFKTEFFLDPSYNWKLFNNCEIINCEYYVRSEAEMSGCNKNPHIITKVVIGTINHDAIMDEETRIKYEKKPDANSNHINREDRPILNRIQTLEDFNRIPPLVSVKEESDTPTPSILGLPLADEEVFNFKI
ncbi:arrestin domain-containing protein 4-like [Culicoides brevitarsis]|uniref:arrestin domain-containing protein 4-like n=1 Tax=Culicoides brevitarsis TaxID=469753 RepID=UPI00307BBA0B